MRLTKAELVRRYKVSSDHHWDSVLSEILSNRVAIYGSNGFFIFNLNALIEISLVLPAQYVIHNRKFYKDKRYLTLEEIFNNFK